MTSVQTLYDFQANLLVIQQLHQRRHRLLIRHQAVHQADRPSTNHGVAPNLLKSTTRITLRALAMIASGNPDFLVIEVQKAAVFIDTANTHQGKVDLNWLIKSALALAYHTAITAHVAAGQQFVKVIFGTEHRRRRWQVIGDGCSGGYGSAAHGRLTRWWYRY